MAQRIHRQDIVIDLEFSRVPKGSRKGGLKNEIVEIGAVRIVDGRTIQDSFNCYVKPQLHQKISPQITALTGIRTFDVQDADTLDVALQKLVEWMGEGRARMVAWSDSDRNQIRKECGIKGIEIPAQLSRWMNLQRIYPRVMDVGNGSQMPLHTAADWYGVAMDEEKAHGALYDAQVTARLFLLIATGEYKQHKAMLDQAIATPEESAQPLTANLGSRFACLADLSRQLSEEAARASA